MDIKPANDVAPGLTYLGFFFFEDSEKTSIKYFIYFTDNRV